jgi:hypothetical protein
LLTLLLVVLGLLRCGGGDFFGVSTSQGEFHGWHFD